MHDLVESCISLMIWSFERNWRHCLGRKGRRGLGNLVIDTGVLVSGTWAKEQDLGREAHRGVSIYLPKESSILFFDCRTSAGKSSADPEVSGHEWSHPTISTHIIQHNLVVQYSTARKSTSTTLISGYILIQN